MKFFCLAVLLLISCKARREHTTTLDRRNAAKFCFEPTEHRSASLSQQVVVTTQNGIKITVNDLVAHARHQSPGFRGRLDNPQKRVELAENVARFEILALEAERLGILSDPDVILRVKTILNQAVREKLSQELVKPDDISPKMIEEFYQANLNHYRAPAKLRVAKLVMRTEAELQKIAKQLTAPSRNDTFFKLLARRYSLEAQTSGGLETELFDREDATIEPAIRNAAFALKEMYEVSKPVKVKAGYALLMKTGMRPEMNRSLDAAHDEIKQLLYQKKRWQSVGDRIDEIYKNATISIREEDLKKIDLIGLLSSEEQQKQK